jgi:uncharacterized protein YaaW (UPF0174 family)
MGACKRIYENHVDEAAASLITNLDVPAYARMQGAGYVAELLEEHVDRISRVGRYAAVRYMKNLGWPVEWAITVVRLSQLH